MTPLHAPLLHAIAGEIDLGRVGDLRAEVSALLDGGPSLLQLDLSGVTFLDCAGLSALEWAVEHGVRRGIVVELVAPSRAVRRLLAMSHHRPSRVARAS